MEVFTITVILNSFLAQELISIIMIPFYRWEIGGKKEAKIIAFFMF